MADGFSRYAALGATVIATGTGVALSISKLIDSKGSYRMPKQMFKKRQALPKTK